MAQIYIIAAAIAILSGCTTLETRLDAAAEKQGQAEAKVTLPAAPADLKKQEPHAVIAEGMEALSVLKRERQALARANARIARWNGFYAALRANLK